MINGRLEAFFETGTEGIIWSLVEPNKGYEGLHCLKNGDYLKVYKENTEEVIWEGTVLLEYERRYRSYPLNPQYGQQEIFGCWVHGFQENLAPEVWSKMFFDGCQASMVVQKDIEKN